MEMGQTNRANSFELSLTHSDSTSIGRAAPDTELATLKQYRSRIAQYRTDLALASAHQNFPWIIVW